MNQDGERVEDKHINILHVMANESFSEFAETLQREIEDDTGMKFGVLQLDLFAGMVYEEQIEREHTIDKAEAQELVRYWTESGMLDQWAEDPEMIAAERIISAQLESGELPAPPNPATEVMRQIKRAQRRSRQPPPLKALPPPLPKLSNVRFPTKKPKN